MSALLVIIAGLVIVAVFNRLHIMRLERRNGYTFSKLDDHERRIRVLEGDLR